MFAVPIHIIANNNNNTITSNPTWTLGDITDGTSVSLQWASIPDDCLLIGCYISDDGLHGMAVFSKFSPVYSYLFGYFQFGTAYNSNTAYTSGSVQALASGNSVPSYQPLNYVPNLNAALSEDFTEMHIIHDGGPTPGGGVYERDGIVEVIQLSTVASGFGIPTSSAAYSLQSPKFSSDYIYSALLHTSRMTGDKYFSEYTPLDKRLLMRGIKSLGSLASFTYTSTSSSWENIDLQTSDDQMYKQYDGNIATLGFEDQHVLRFSYFYGSNYDGVEKIFHSKLKNYDSSPYTEFVGSRGLTSSATGTDIGSGPGHINLQQSTRANNAPVGRINFSPKICIPNVDRIYRSFIDKQSSSSGGLKLNLSDFYTNFRDTSSSSGLTSFLISSSSSPSEYASCQASGSVTTRYHDGSNPDPGLNDIVYTDYEGITRLSGGSSWYKLLSGHSIKIGSQGVIEATHECITTTQVNSFLASPLGELTQSQSCSTGGVVITRYFQTVGLNTEPEVGNTIFIDALAQTALNGSDKYFKIASGFATIRVNSLGIVTDKSICL